MATIYIVEDDVNIREIERYALKNSGYEVEEFESGESLFKRLERAVPSLLLLDIMLPDEDGLEILGKLRANKNTAAIPVIMVTAKTSELDKVKGLDLGADDYITKPFNILEVKARIKAIMRRTSPERAPQVQSSVIEKGDIKLDCDSRRLFINDNEINLTAREFELLEILIKNENKVYSRESLLKIVWGEDYPGDVRTVDVHVRRLREKIEANPSEPKYVHTKWGVGYYYNQK